ncbi:hypothetical protein IHE31_15110 [Mycetohabitans rhizoxinica]|uniref:hypothetical protein n=1 Tax=Mycetohabitans rhizoxinica TaxID=412963 RepID=UPI0030D2C8F5
MSFTRLLPPLREVSEAIANASHGIDALCELLDKTDTGQVHAQSVYLLLDPLCRQLIHASSDLDDIL